MDKKMGHYIVHINNTEKVPIRVVGVINQEACDAVVNLPEAARKLMTAEGVDVEAVYPFGKRFVFVMKEPSKMLNIDQAPSIYVSAVVEAITYSQQLKQYECKDNDLGTRSFHFEEVGTNKT